MKTLRIALTTHGIQIDIATISPFTTLMVRSNFFSFDSPCAVTKIHITCVFFFSLLFRIKSTTVTIVSFERKFFFLFKQVENNGMLLKVDEESNGYVLRSVSTFQNIFSQGRHRIRINLGNMYFRSGFDGVQLKEIRLKMHFWSNEQ